MLKELGNISTLIILRTFWLLLYAVLEVVQSINIGALPPPLPLSPPFSMAVSLEEAECLKEIIAL